MMRTRPLLASMFAAIGFAVVPAMFPVGLAQAADALRQEVGKPLKEAQELMKKSKFREALAKVNEASNASGKNDYENYMIERMRGSAAAGAGDTATAAKSFESILGSGRLSGAEKLSIMEALAGTYFRAKNYNASTEWAQRYQKEGGTNQKVIALISQAKLAGGDVAGTARDTLAAVNATIKAGGTPSESSLKTLLYCYSTLKDNKGISLALEKLVTYHPSKSYWEQVINRIQRNDGFSNRHALDVLRLKLAVGIIGTAENIEEAKKLEYAKKEYMEASQLALQDGFNAEAKKIVDKGFAANILGVGTEADREKRLKALVDKKLSEDAKTMADAEKDALALKDGNALVNLGLNYIGNGKNDKGIPLVEQGLKQEKTKRPEDAKLRAGIAYLQAGQKAKAVQILKTVTGEDGTADLARLWVLSSR